MESKELRLKRFHLILLIFLMFMGGCAQKIPTQSAASRNWKGELNQLSHWQLKGKVAFLTEKKKQSANLNWQFDHPHHKIKLTSFIGTQILSLEENDNGVVIDMGDERFAGFQTDVLLQQLTGFLLPVDQAHLWLTAQMPLRDAMFDEQSRLKSGDWYDTTGNQWHIVYDKYQMTNGLWLPSRLSLKTEQMTIKLQINEWTL